MYPKTILTMAQNLVLSAGLDPNIEAGKYYVIWNAILNYHFPLDKDYGGGFCHVAFPSIYGLAGVGLWTVVRVDNMGSHQAEVVVPWRSDITSAWAFSARRGVVSQIDEMTAPESG